MIDRDTPYDPEQELNEFVVDIASERFLYQQWLDRIATSYTVSADEFIGQFKEIPDYLRHIRGITGNVRIGFEANRVHDDNMQITKLRLRTLDEMDITIVNDHGLFLMQHDGRAYLMPDNAPYEIFLMLFSERDRHKPIEELVEYIAKHSPASVHEQEFQAVGVNGSDIKVSLVTSETADDSTMSLEVTTVLPHPSTSLVGTRLTMYDSLRSASHRTAIVPDASVNIDVIPTSDDSLLIVESLQVGVTVDVKRPTRYHEENIIEALYTLELAAKSAT